MIHERLRRIKRVILSIGHDPKSQGAENRKGEKENTLCTNIALLIAEHLRANGLVVWLLPDFSLPDTIQYVNTQGNALTDIAFEIHKDSCGSAYNDQNMNRRCGLYFETNSAGAKIIAETMIGSMEYSGAHETSWVRPDTESNHKRLGFCSRTKMLAMIAELGFIEGNNDKDECEWYAWTFAKSVLMVLDMPIRSVPFDFTTFKPVI